MYESTDANGEQYFSDTQKPVQNFASFPYIALCSDFGLKKWRFGVANYFPNLAGGSLSENGPARYYLIEGFSVTNYTSMAAAWHPIESLAVGVSLDAIYALQQGYQKLNPDDLLPGLGISDLRIHLKSSDFRFGFHAGLLYKPSEKFRIGISYFDRTDFLFKGKIRIQTSNNEVLFGYDKITTDVEETWFVPRTVKGGFNAIINDKWNWGMDFYFWDYSKWKKSERRFPNLKDHPLGPIVIAGLGGDTLVSPKNYEDSYQVSLGAECRVKPDWLIRFGIQYDLSPCPDKYFTVDSLTNDNIDIGFGFAHEMGPHSQIAFSWQHVFFTLRNTAEIPDASTKVKILESYTDSFSVEYRYRF